jgi:phage terminase small subunit
MFCVETVCHLSDEAATYRRLIHTAGPLLKEPIVTPSGAVVGNRIVPNPAVAMLRKVEAQMERELSNLGFNPVARSRLGLAEVKARSILEDLISGSTEVAAQVIDIAADEA